MGLDSTRLPTPTCRTVSGDSLDGVSNADVAVSLRVPDRSPEQAMVDFFRSIEEDAGVTGREGATTAMG